MSQLGTRLREFYKQSRYRSMAALTEAAQGYTEISESYIKQLMRGVRQRPSYDKLFGIIQALDLSREQADELLLLAGFPPSQTSDNDQITPQIQRMIDALVRLRQMPGLPAQSFEAVADGFIQMVEGVRFAFEADETTISDQADVKSSLQPALHRLPASNLPIEESVLDDLLGDLFSRSDDDPISNLFVTLKQVVGEDRWESKRRVTEALPQLVQMQPEATFELAYALRDDYHPDYRADIRRRVVEAVPSFYAANPEMALALLAFRERDEVYIAMATLEVLHDLEVAQQLTAEKAQQHLAAIHVDDDTQQAVIDDLKILLLEVRQNPTAALHRLQHMQTVDDRLVKIVVQRTAPRLFESFPIEALHLMFAALRKNEDGFPIEHQNVRRPVSKALPQIYTLWADAEPALADQITEILRALAQDPDIHVRRALGDSLNRLILFDSDLAVDTMELLIQDKDPYVCQRALSAFFKLADRYPEKAQTYSARLFTARM
ncbi:MAG: hypothetical protein AAF629_20875 [Chloroflexota bacterium]